MSKYPEQVFQGFFRSIPDDLTNYLPLAEQAIRGLFEDASKDLGNEKTFISTGDIPAMWLRDSSFQVKPLIYFSKNSEIYDYVASVIEQQAFYIQIELCAYPFNI